MTSPTNIDPRPADTAEHAPPRTEAWLKVIFAAFIPLVLALYLPPELKMPMFVAGALLVAGGLAMLVRQEMRSR